MDTPATLRTDTSRDRLRGLWPAIDTPVLLIGLVVLVLILTAPFGSLSQTMTEMMIRIVLVVGLYVFVGNSGILSFGHISFMSIGAYAFVWFSCCTLPMVKPLYLPGLPLFLQELALPSPVGIAAAAIIAGAAAFLIAAILMRLSGTAASIATFALLSAQYAFYLNWSDVTGGTASLANLPTFMSPAVGALFAGLAIVVAWLHQESRWGVMLRAARDDQTAARASGINVWLVRTLAFGLSGLVVGVGGALQAGSLGVVTVDSFYLGVTFLTLAMLIVGGSGSLSGAVVGVLVLTAVTEVLRRLESGIPLGESTLALPGGFQEIGLGLAMILFMMFRPAGIMGGREIRTPGRAGRIRRSAPGLPPV